MIVLDTDVLTIVQRATGPEYARLVSRLEAAPAQPVGVTIISFEEQMRGWATEAGLTALRYRVLPADPKAKGPALFSMLATNSKR